MVRGELHTKNRVQIQSFPNNQDKLCRNTGNFSFLFFSIFLLVSTKGMLLGYDSMNFWDFPDLS